MKTTNSFIISIAVCLLFSSCAVVVNYGAPSPNCGNIVIKPTSAVYANLTLNDSLLVKYKYVKSITIKNVPVGVNTIHLSGESNTLKESLDIKNEIKVIAGKTNTQLVTVPPKSTGYWIYSIGSLLILWALVLDY